MEPTTKHSHKFVMNEDGVDRCQICFISWSDHARGFGSNVAPKVKRTRPLKGL